MKDEAHLVGATNYNTKSLGYIRLRIILQTNKKNLTLQMWVAVCCRSLFSQTSSCMEYCFVTFLLNLSEVIRTKWECFIWLAFLTSFTATTSILYRTNLAPLMISGIADEQNLVAGSTMMLLSSLDLFDTGSAMISRRRCGCDLICCCLWWVTLFLHGLADLTQQIQRLSSLRYAPKNK